MAPGGKAGPSKASTSKASTSKASTSKASTSKASKSTKQASKKVATKAKPSKGKGKAVANDSEDDDSEQSEEESPRGKGKGKGKGKAKAKANQLPKGVYHGEAGILEYSREQGYDDPSWYKDTLELPIKHIKFEGGHVTTDKKRLQAHENHYKRLNGIIPSNLITTGTTSPFSGECQAAAVVGFGDISVKGVEKFLVFVDNHAHTVFGPLQRVLTQRIEVGIEYDFHQSMDTCTFFEYVINSKDAEYDEWYDNMIQSKDYIGALPQAIREDPKHSYYFGFVGACFALAKEHPELFIEREGDVKGTYVRGVSLEDIMRCSIVARHYVKRRKSGDYGTSNRRSPSVNSQKVDLHSTVIFYQTQEEIAEAATLENDVAFGEKYSLGIDVTLELLRNSGLSEEINLQEQEAYNDMDEDDQDDFCYRHIDALEKMRVAWYHSSKDNEVGRKMPYMDEKTKQSLLALMRSRIHNKEEGNNPLALLDSISEEDQQNLDTLKAGIIDLMESADREEPGFENDETRIASQEVNPLGQSTQIGSMSGIRQPRNSDFTEEYEKSLKDNFNKVMDEFFGGNDSDEMDMKQAQALTGMSYLDPRINPENPNSTAKLHEHQIVDTALLTQKLEYYPHAALLANACGTSKTATYMATILQIVKNQIEAWQQAKDNNDAEDEQEKFYPSIVFVPATLVKPTFDECQRLFRHLLDPYIYYGNRGDYKGDAIAQSKFIGAGLLDTKLKGFPPTKPDSARVLIITSYVTFKRRETQAVTKKRRNLTYEDRVFLGHHLADSPSSIDRRSNAERDLEKEEKEQNELERDLRKDRDEDETTEQDPDDEESSEDEDEVRRRIATEMIEDNTLIPEDQVDDEVQEINSAMDTIGGRKANPEKQQEQMYTLYKPKHEQKWNLVVCDEAHLLKNPKSATHKAIKCLDRQFWLAVTATPMLNTIMDILSLLQLAMPKSSATYTPPNFSYHTMYGIGEELDLFEPDKDPRESSYLVRQGKGKLEDVLAAAKRDSTRDTGPMFTKNHPLLDDYIYNPPEDAPELEDSHPVMEFGDPEYQAKWEAYERIDRKWWQLQPCNARWAAKEFGETFDGARLLLLPICKQLCVKRGMQTILELPDGRKVRPGDELKGACFRVVNVQFTPEDQLSYNASWNVWGKKLYTIDKSNEKKQDDGRGKDLLERPGNNVDDNGQPRINTRAVRHLVLPAQNLHNVRLLEPRAKTAGLVKVTESARQRQSRRSQDKMAQLSQASVSRGTGRRKDPGAEMGVEEVLALIKGHPQDGGANWVYEVLKAGPEYAPICNRQQFIHFHAYRSPIICAMILQVYEWMQQPRGKDGLPNRVVIMANMPWIQQEAALILQMWGWNVETIRSDHTVQERNMCIDKFNDPESNVDILLTSMDLSAYGLNLHKACCKGIILQWPWNANHLLQILGRLPRIGQKRFVEWVIFHMPGTIYDKMQTIVWSKYIKQLAVESKIPKELSGVWAELAAYGKIYELFNLPDAIVEQLEKKLEFAEMEIEADLVTGIRRKARERGDGAGNDRSALISLFYKYELDKERKRKRGRDVELEKPNRKRARVVVEVSDSAESSSGDSSSDSE
ncbi:hypothetical protein EV127DRAFT_515486 [Xylaria flabelliformis]|nr:hypothetical protein EV127DRAFT_515486 [Xylaria flabelliformis]